MQNIQTQTKVKIYRDVNPYSRRTNLGDWVGIMRSERDIAAGRVYTFEEVFQRLEDLLDARKL